ncbi:AAA family ATPase [Rothia nasimurium]|uniref:AAA family ATPase n=1 Tax=Rothia nasimurium TaxID=85336 RepID=UPI001F2619C2|nr:AAA family ATPase [Rothia nasimurium]
MSELVYIYINRINFNQFQNQEINLASDIQFSTTKIDDLFQLEFTRSEKSSMVPRGFFGQNITNINVVTGKNGSGKTTLLKSIGSQSHDAQLNDADSIFLIYRISHDEFYIDGPEWLVTNIDTSSISENIRILNKDIDSLEEYNNQKVSVSYHHIYPLVSWTDNFSKIKNNRTREKENELITYSEASPDDIRNIFKLISSKFRLLIENKKYHFSAKIFLPEIRDTNEFYEWIYNGTFDFKINNSDTSNHFIDYQSSNKDKLIIELIEKFIANLAAKYYLKDKQFISKLRVATSTVLRNGKYAINDSTYERRIYLTSLLKNKYFIESVKNITVTNRDESGKSNDLELNFQESSRKKSLTKNIQSHIIERKFGRMNDLIDTIVNLPEAMFLPQEIRVDAGNYESFDPETLDGINDIIKYKEFFRFNFSNLSDGEVTYLSIFASIFNELSSKPSISNFIIILDEPDMNLHPEWCRNFINHCIQMGLKFPNSNIQYIISTHSPYMVSDIPRQNIISLSYNPKKMTVDINKPNKSFAANIIEILADNFYLEHPLGEFARTKISSDEIKNYIYLVDNPVLKTILEAND